MSVALLQLFPAAKIFDVMRHSDKVSKVYNAGDAVVTGVSEGFDLSFSWSEFIDGLKGLFLGVSRDGFLGNMGEACHGFVSNFAQNALKSLPGVSIGFGIKNLGTAIYNFCQGGASNIFEGFLQLGSALSSLVPGGKIAMEAITASTKQFLGSKTLFNILKEDKGIRGEFIGKYKAELLKHSGKPISRDLTQSVRTKVYEDLRKSNSGFSGRFDDLYKAKALEYADKPLFLRDSLNQMVANLRHSSIEAYESMKLSKIPSTLRPLTSS